MKIKNPIIKTLMIIAMVMIRGSGTGLMAHPGHTAHDMHQYTIFHYLTYPGHLLVIFLAVAVLWLVAMLAKHYLGRSDGVKP